MATTTHPQPDSRRSSSIDSHDHHYHQPHHPSQDPTATSTLRRESRLQTWISEQCHLMVQDMGMGVEMSGVDEAGDEPPLFSASTYVPVAQRSGKAGAAAAVDPSSSSTSANHKKTDSAVSSLSTSSSSHSHGAAAIASANGISAGWYWRTSGSSSGGSSEQDSLLASYILPSHPHSTRGDSDVIIIGEEALHEDDVDARSDSPLLGFGSDSEEEDAGAALAVQQSHDQLLKIHRRSHSSEFMDFPRTPGPEDMDSAFLTLSPTTPKQDLKLRSPPRDKLRYPKKGYRRELPSGLDDDVRHFYPSMSPQQIHSPSKTHSNSPFGSSREDEVTTPVPHHHRGAAPMAAQQQRKSLSPPTSPSLIPSSPSLFPTSSLSSYPSVTSLSSLHSQGQQQQVPSLHSRPSLQSLHQQHVSPQHSPQLSRPHSLSRKPSLARKPSFPLLKEVKEEDVEGDAVSGALPDTPPHDILKHEREDHLMTSTEVSAAVPPSPSSQAPPVPVPTTPATTTTALLESLTLSPTGTEETVTSGTSSSGSASTIVPSSTATSRVPVNSRMRSQSASVVTQLQQTHQGYTSPGSNSNNAAAAHAHAHAYHHAHSYSYSHSHSGSAIGSPMPGFGGSSSATSSTSATSLLPSPMPPSLHPDSAVLSAASEDVVEGLEEWSFPPVPPRLSRASVGLGLGPGVGVRTQTRSRSGSDANLLSNFSISPGLRTPPGTSLLQSAGSPSNGRVTSEVEPGAGTRHAVYIVDSEEVRRRLGELLENRGSTFLDEEDEEEDWESRRRTVVAVTTTDAEEEESRQPEPIVEEAPEKEQADPVLPLGHLFSRRPVPLVHSASMPVVPQYSSPPDSRPVTPPPSVGHRLSYSVGTVINVTPTRKAPFPPSSQTCTPRRQRTVADGDFGSPSSMVMMPPPNTPATASVNGHGGSFGIYASPYASSSQIYLGPQNGSGSAEHSRSPSSKSGSSSSSKTHSRSPSKSTTHSRSSLYASRSRAGSVVVLNQDDVAGALSSPPLPPLPSTPLSPPPPPPPHSPQGHGLLEAAPILTKADLARRLGPPPKRPPPAPPLDLGMDSMAMGGMYGLNGGFRFPSPLPSPGIASAPAHFGGGDMDENAVRRMSRSHRRSAQRSEEPGAGEGFGFGYAGWPGAGPHSVEGGAEAEFDDVGEMMEAEMEHDEEIEALRREMGLDLDHDGRHHHQQDFLGDEEMGMISRSSRRTSDYLGEGEDTLRARGNGDARPALQVNVSRGSKRWSVDSVVLKDLAPSPHQLAAGPTSPPLPPIPQSPAAVQGDAFQRRHHHQRKQESEEVPKSERTASYFDDDDSDDEDDFGDEDMIPMMGMAMMGVSVGGMMGVGAGVRSAKRKVSGGKGASSTANANGAATKSSRRGWGRRSREEKKDEKPKSAPSSPITLRKSREEKRKSFGRGGDAGNGVQGEEGSGNTSGKSRGRLASFFSKLAGSSSASSPSTANSSPSTYSPSGGHDRKTIANANASEPDLRAASGAWEALPSERVPPVPPVPPLHTLPRMESKSSLKSLGSQGRSKSRRATMISQQWDDEDNYGTVISGGNGVGNSVPPTPSSLASGFSMNGAGTSPRESRASSVIGGVGPNGLGGGLRMSRSVSNLHLMANRGGIQELGAGASGWVLSPPSTPGMEQGFNVIDNPSSPSQQQGDVLRKSDDSGASLPPPPVPPKDFVAAGMHEWPPSPSLPSIPGSASSTNGLFPPGISSPNGSANGVGMNPDKARDRMMVRLRLKSSPSLGSLRAQQQQSQSGKKLRNFAARMMGKEEHA